MCVIEYICTVWCTKHPAPTQFHTTPKHPHPLFPLSPILHPPTHPPPLNKTHTHTNTKPYTHTPVETPHPRRAALSKGHLSSINATLSLCTTVYSLKVEVPIKWYRGLPSLLKRGLLSLFMMPWVCGIGGGSVEEVVLEVVWWCGGGAGALSLCVCTVITACLYIGWIYFHMYFACV